MQPLEHTPVVPGIGAQVSANGLRGLAGGTAANAAVTALVPAGAEEVSMQAALAFATEGMESLGINAMAQEELARAGEAYAEASGVYETVDGANATTLT
jgi:PE family